MKQLPVVETAFRDWLSENHEDLEFYQSMIPIFMAEEGMLHLAPQVPLPGAIPWGIATGSGFPDTYWMGILFFASYMQTRRTYFVDPVLLEALEGCKWPGNTPSEALAHLPLPAFAMEMPTGEVYTVCYDLLTGRERENELEIRIGRIIDRKVVPATIIHLVGTIDEGVSSAINKVVSKAAEDDRFMSAQGDLAIDTFKTSVRHEAEKLVNILLYLAGNDDVVKRVGEKLPRPAKRHKRALAGTKHERVLEEAHEEMDLGLSMRQAMIRYREAEEAEMEKAGSGRSPRPHMRSAHAHLYWTGPGKTVPVVKYLAPIPVKGGKEIRPSGQDVK
jgi:hypothetical protein